jgi:hypothetical protein
VWVKANGTASAPTAVQFINSQIVSGTFLVPNGRIYMSNVSQMYGALWAVTVSFNSDVTSTSDTSGLPSSLATPYSNFNYLRSWKDQ